MCCVNDVEENKMSAVKRGIRLLLLTGIFGASFLAGCAIALQFDLSETVEPPGTGHTIDYPDGWYVESQPAFRPIVISAKETELYNGSYQHERFISAFQKDYEIWMVIRSRALPTETYVGG